MKIISLITFTILIMISCKSIHIDPNGIIGKWQFTGIAQHQNSDGNWTPWRVNPTLLKTNPSIFEFTNDGYFLRNGKNGADCCFFGNKYTVKEHKISFSETLNCPNVDCSARADCLLIKEIKGDTLILEYCGNLRNKLVRIK